MQLDRELIVKLTHDVDEFFDIGVLGVAWRPADHANASTIINVGAQCATLLTTNTNWQAMCLV